jgi:tetratricopeptide (TPR) repeat protein
MLGILTNQPYTPNYHSFYVVQQWMNDGSLTDENISIAGLAEQLRTLISSERELNSLGYLLLKQDKKKEALKIFQVNYNLFPESSTINSSLGEGYYENGDYKKAIVSLERSLELNKEPKAVKEILVILYKAKEKDKG